MFNTLFYFVSDNIYNNNVSNIYNISTKENYENYMKMMNCIH